MAFDAMAAAVDWLDAYRAGDIDSILNMHAPDAVVECGCEGLTIVGKEGLRAYWERRLKDYPASDLEDLRPDANGARISYLVRDSAVGAILKFDANGRISRLHCAPIGALPRPHHGQDVGPLSIS